MVSIYTSAETICLTPTLSLATLAWRVDAWVQWKYIACKSGTPKNAMAYIHRNKSIIFGNQLDMLMLVQKSVKNVKRKKMTPMLYLRNKEHSMGQQ